MDPLFSFNARTVKGRGRGKQIGAPTINMELDDVPSTMDEGIYACWVRLEKRWVQGALHYGPRPVFKDDVSCEVFLLDVSVEHLPERIEVQIVERLRPVLDFPTPHDLMRQINDDVARTRAILDGNGPPSDQAAGS